jgi:hypothetical protein
MFLKEQHRVAAQLAIFARDSRALTAVVFSSVGVAGSYVDMDSCGNEFFQSATARLFEIYAS